MIQQITFTVIAFVLFIYVLLWKMIKKNDTTYLVIIGIQAIGILLNLIRITFNKLQGITYTIILYLTCIIIPVCVFLLEFKGANVSSILSILRAQIYIWLKNTKKAKTILLDLVNKYKDDYVAHKMLAHIYENEGGMRKAIDEYVKVLDIKKDDYKSYYRIINLLNELGKKDEAVEMLKTLLNKKPDIYEASKMLRRDLFRTKGI